MDMSFREFKHYDHSFFEKEILDFWENQDVFHESIRDREGHEQFVFYEGPPSANGMPGIHHVMARAIKDLFCRYKTLKGFQVKRKGGWDTHGLPVELSVEKLLGITKKDIGSKISVEDYNASCRKEVMHYKDAWDDITRKIGYWVDLDDPYITYENDYIETLWNLLKRLYDKGLLYKGLKIQPYSPAAGTGLSSHELNLPGTYKMVKDTTVTAQFKVIRSEESGFLFNSETEGVYFLAWTTTPWTLPSNTALTVGKKITYVKVETYNPYTKLPVSVILAKDLLPKYFDASHAELSMEDYSAENKAIPYRISGEYTGQDLLGMRYEQLIPLQQPDDGDAFIVIHGDFVTTEDGTGIVHTAPSFGADDRMVAAQNGIGSLTLVDKQGKFIDQAGEFAGRYVKNYKDDADYESVDIDIVVKLKQENLAFKVAKYEHSYPHCWRTDKPILYYPLDSWFIKVTAVKERMIELNKSINWKPKNTGEGRFGKWLENLVDWNLSRTRYWGTPLPIWRTKDSSSEICIGSVEELRNEVDKAVAAGFMDSPISTDFDLHKPYVDKIVLVTENGVPMYREPDLIDVWFDSGAMPYAQWHWPFENEEVFRESFPANFIAEGVDQTRGWFYTLHALGTMLFDSVAFKNVVSNGLVLDKAGNKMSKRLGNAADPFETIAKYGSDATRWYMMSNSQPWDNLKFDLAGIDETRRKLFGTLANTYSFFALYANIDGFDPTKEKEIPLAERPEIDRWVISLLNSLIKEVDACYADYEPTKAARAIQEFVLDNLSNWYVRLCRRRFWKGDYSADKISAYQTLHHCLDVVSVLMSPIAPFYGDFLYRNLRMSGMEDLVSVHLTEFPKVDESVIDKDLEDRMDKAQKISSMVLSLRKRETIKVRQPLQRILLPVLDNHFEEQVEKVKTLILSEVNVKEIEYLQDTSGVVKKKVKPDFKALGRKLGPKMKDLVKLLNGLDQDAIRDFETAGEKEVILQGESYMLNIEDVEIQSEDIEGWLVASQDGLTVALDVHISDDLKNEGYAREVVNRIQKERKERGFEVTDRIKVSVEESDTANSTVEAFGDYIAAEVLASSINVVPLRSINENQFEIELEETVLKITIQKA
ncbi:MAG: isoleucine--tRNA ligase [Bacteroidetes bacterium]|nr:isoleucine--tRNA ligase [Bacteroidota bacterium]